MAERTKKGKKVPRKYLTKDKSAMKKEIDKFSGTDKYKEKWDADYKGKGVKSGERYKTKKSDATKAYQKTFGEDASSKLLSFIEFTSLGRVNYFLT